MRRADADVVIAGGGLAAQRCAETLRRAGFEGRIVVLCEESLPPYDRPPLSKAVLAGERDPGELALRAAPWYAEHDVELLLGVAAAEFDGVRHTVGLRGAEDGVLRYRHLVIATGSRPRRLPGLQPGGAIHELRSAADALALRARLAAHRGPLVVLGAGLVGMEVASVARARGHEVTLVEAAATPLGRALPPSLGAWLAGVHRAHGVDVRLATVVREMDAGEDRATLTLSDGTAIEGATVLVAAGTVPATGWLADGRPQAGGRPVRRSGSGAGPALPGGREEGPALPGGREEGPALPSGRAAGPIETDEAGRTRWPDVYAAGDAACFPDPYLGAHVPTQHWEAAVRQGTAVARAIVGLVPVEVPPPMFWSDQHGRRIQLVGHAPAGCEIEYEGDPGAEQPFVAWLTREGAPAGVLLVDRPDVLRRARRWVARADDDGLARAA